MNKTEKLREKIVKPLCEACLPYVCSYLDLPPKERLEKCKPLKDWTGQILQVFKEAGLVFLDYSI